jgi:hypothetical protein
MTGQHNWVHVGGDVDGVVVAGTGNVVGPAAPAAPGPVTGLRSRLGFVFDVVGYGRRTAVLKSDVQRRLRALVDGMLTDIGVAVDDTLGDGSGDGITVFLPVGLDYTRALPGLLNSAAAGLTSDNERYRDRMRLRMAIGTGLVGPPDPTGFTGELIIDLNRLLDSTVLRQAVLNNLDSDLVVLVTNALYDDVIRPGYLNPAPFTRVDVTTKEFSAPAWLWIS